MLTFCRSKEDGEQAFLFVQNTNILERGFIHFLKVIKTRVNECLVITFYINPVVPNRFEYVYKVED